MKNAGVVQAATTPDDASPGSFEERGAIERYSRRAVGGRNRSRLGGGRFLVWFHVGLILSSVGRPGHKDFDRRAPPQTKPWRSLLSTASSWNADFIDLIACLNTERAEYVVVGAFALAAHGLPRATGDIDFLVRPSADNVRRVFAAPQGIWIVPSGDGCGGKTGLVKKPPACTRHVPGETCPEKGASRCFAATL